MIEFFRSGGVVMWPMLAVAFGIVWITFRTVARLRSTNPREHEVRRGLQAILFWGGLSVLLGFLGTVIGIIIMTQAIGLYGAVEARLIWGGVGVSLISFIFGILIFLFAALAWFALHQWHLRIVERGEGYAA